MLCKQKSTTLPWLIIKRKNLLRYIFEYYLRRHKWVIEGVYPYHIPKMVIAVAPHTSNWDFILGLAVRSRLKLHHVRFLGKAELFKPPFGFIFRRLGGTPVDRRSSRNMVEQVVDTFQQHERFTLVLSPEGTRKRVERLRSGFYHIAVGAGAPILPVGFDVGAKKVILAPLFYPTGNWEADVAELLRFWRPMQGFLPEQGLGHL
jgi:1-acyl-sn-glycerol-3-phosphate acyltransferase